MSHIFQAWRWMVLSAACGLFAMTAACAKFQPRPTEQGPRITAIQGSTAGLTAASGGTSTLRVSMVHGNHTLNFDVQISNTPTSTLAQRIEMTDYALQASCIDVYCDRVGFLLTMTSYGNSSNGVVAPVSGYGGSREYITGRSSKSYLFRKTVNGGLEQIASKQGSYQGLGDAMRDLGAYL